MTTALVILAVLALVVGLAALREQAVAARINRVSDQLARLRRSVNAPRAHN